MGYPVTSQTTNSNAYAIFVEIISSRLMNEKICTAAKPQPLNKIVAEGSQPN